MRSAFRAESGLRAPALARALAATALVFATLACGGSGASEQVRVVIPSGTTFRAATDSLKRAGVVGSPRLFRIYASLKGRDRDLKAGTYLLRRGSSWGVVLSALTDGRGVVRTLTVPEGWALSAIVPALARTLETAEDSVNIAVRDSALLRRLDVPTKTLEGYLFPDTYAFPLGTPARDAVEQMVLRFEQTWRPEWNARLLELAMSRHDIITLASIIESEARLAEERPVISAVYHNRLRIGMRLEADPTVQYALGRHTKRLMYKDLDVVSPYNTYRNKGLPPGPISSPGAASITAALFPADAPFLFFVAHPDGHHEFRRTLAEHNAARQMIRRKAAARQADTARDN